MKTKTYLVERWAAYRVAAFWARVARAGDAECWAWTGLSRSARGGGPYGRLRWKGRDAKAHRVAFDLCCGPIPAGAMVLHRCDNPLCCNPAHLYLGDHERNMRDMVERGRRKGKCAGEANGRAKLSPDKAEKIRRLYGAGGLSQQAIAERFEVSQNAVSKVVRGLRYARPEAA